MKKIAFILTFPNVGSWDGKFSGEGRLHARVYSFDNKTAEQLLSNGSYYHSFGDGWTASIEPKHVNYKEANWIKKHTKGFYGYEWMIDDMKQLAMAGLVD